MNTSYLKVQFILVLLFLFLFTIKLFGQTEAVRTFKPENDTIYIPYEEIQTDCLCLGFNTYIIIDSDTILSKLIQENQDNPNCIGYYPENYNSEEEILVGIGLRYSGCGPPKIDITTYEISSSKTVEVNVNVHRSGNCLTLAYKFIWIKFNKPNDYNEIHVFDDRNKLTRKYSCYEKF